MDVRRLCILCSHIDLAECRTEEGYQHHHNYADLCKSRDEGCQLCCLIVQHFDIWMDEMLRWDHYIPETNFDFEGARNCRLTLKYSPSRETGVRERFDFMLLKDHGFRVVFCTTADDPAASWLAGRCLDAQGDSSLCFDQGRQWLHQCLTEHDSCRVVTSDSMPLLPTRVIDIGPKDSPIQPRLRISDKGETGQWVAVSHCWGKVWPLTTGKDDLMEKIKEIPLDSFPPLFRDALHITRELGYQYIWIDSLCIIQDSPDDWSAESQTMGRIYGDSIVCISAEDCEGSKTGIFESGKVRNSYNEQLIRVPCFNSSEPGITGTMFTGLWWSGSRSLPGPLSKRAWTLQEELLSPRTLRWTTKQLEWACRALERVEQYPNEESHHNSNILACKRVCGLPNELSSEMVDPAMWSTPTAVYSVWTQIVSRASARNITRETDRFPSLSGIAKVVHLRTGWSYKAGLWLEKIHEELLWDLPGSGATRTKEYTDYVAPSWSWASVFFQEDELKWFYPSQENFKYTDSLEHQSETLQTHPGIQFFTAERDWTTTTTIDDVNVVVMDGEFGRVKSATLKISGLAKRSGQTVYLQILTGPRGVCYGITLKLSEGGKRPKTTRFQRLRNTLKIFWMISSRVLELRSERRNSGTNNHGSKTDFLSAFSSESQHSIYRRVEAWSSDPYFGYRSGREWRNFSAEFWNSGWKMETFIII